MLRRTRAFLDQTSPALLTSAGPGASSYATAAHPGLGLPKALPARGTKEVMDAADGDAHLASATAGQAVTASTGEGGEEERKGDALFLHCEAMRLLGKVLRAHDVAALRALAGDALDLARRHGGASAHAAAAAAEVVCAARDWAGLALSVEQLQVRACSLWGKHDRV